MDEQASVPGWDRVIDAGAVPNVSQDVLDRIRMMIQDEAHISIPRASTSEPSRRPRSRHWLVPGSLLTAVAAFAALVAIVLIGRTPGALPQAGQSGSATSIAQSGEPTAAQILFEQASSVVARSTPVSWRDANYWHTARTVIAADGTKTTIDRWEGRSRPSVIHVEPGGAVSADGVEDSGFTYGTKTVTWEQLYELPTDAVQLQALLESAANPGMKVSDEVYAMISDLLIAAPISSALRQALFDVAATLDASRLIGNVTDVRGRNGITVDHNFGQYTLRLVVDANTGNLLQRQYFTNVPLDAVASSDVPQPTSSVDGFSPGRSLDGSRPALAAGALAETDVLIESSAANTAPPTK